MAQLRKPYTASQIYVNLLTSAILITLIALAVHVRETRFVISPTSSPGYQAIKLDDTSWNVACTVVGTAVGLLATAGFAMQDDVLTRKQIVDARGVTAIFLRPLSMRRGVAQILRLQLPIERTLLLLLTVLTALTSAAVVALFGIRASTETIVNNDASFPVSYLNFPTFDNYHDGGVTLIPASGQADSEAVELNSFLYRAAYINSRKAYGIYSNYDFDYNNKVPERGTLGGTLYDSLNTGGIGIDVASYSHFSGGPTGDYDLPTRFEFQSLHASVYGTHVNVSCENASAEYKLKVVADILEYDFYSVYALSKPGGPEIIVYGKEFDLVLGSAAWMSDGELIHTLVFPRLTVDRALVLECRYRGRDYEADVSVDSATSPIKIDRITGQGPHLGLNVKRALASKTGGLIAASGGNLVRGLQDAGVDWIIGLDDKKLIGVVEETLSQFGEAYISIRRQGVEASNTGFPIIPPDLWRKLHLTITVTRLGGASYGWLAVLGALLVGTLWGGAVKLCSSGLTADFEAQDTVKLLRSALGNKDVCSTSRIKYDKDGGIEVLRAPASEQRTPGDTPSAPASEKQPRMHL